MAQPGSQATPAGPVGPGLVFPEMQQPDAVAHISMRPASGRQQAAAGAGVRKATELDQQAPVPAKLPCLSPAGLQGLQRSQVGGRLLWWWLAGCSGSAGDGAALHCCELLRL